MKKFITILIFLIVTFSTTSYQELNQLAIITNIGINEKKDYYEIIYQEIVPLKEENKINKKYKYYTNKGSNLQRAFLKLNEDTTKYIYFDHLENIVINSKNKKILDELLNYFDKDIDSFNIIFTDSNVSKVLKYSNNYKYLNNLIDDNISFREIKKAKLENKNIKIPVIRLKNNNLSFYKYIKLGDKND